MKKKKVTALTLAVFMMIAVFSGCTNKTDTTASNEAPKKQADASNETEGETATDWPKKTIELIVPFKAGGDTDFHARTYAKYLEKELGVSVIVVNIEGAGGSIGSTTVKDESPEGYKVLCFDTALALNQASGVTDFGVEAFEVAGVIGKSTGEYLVVRKDFPADTVQELIDLTIKEPDKYKLAANTGATSYYVATRLKELGAKFNVVNAGSSSERVASLLGGHIDVSVNAMGVISQYLETGDFKVLACCGTQRSEAYPDIPLATEQGVDLSYDIVYNMLLPKGTDPKITEKLNQAILKISNENAEFANDIYTTYGEKPYALPVAKSKAYLEEEQAQYMKYADVFQGK